MRKLRNTKWFVPILILAICLIAVGGVFAALATISNTWESPAITVVPSPTPTPENLPLEVSADGFTTPVEIYIDAPFTASVTLDNPSPTGAPGYVDVLLEFTINRTTTGIATGDVTLEYYDGVNWHTLTLVDDGDSLSGTFGPSGGFPVVTGYNATTDFRVTFHTAGVYSATCVAVQL